MANAGFNAATDIFGMGANWEVKSSDDNASGSVAECPNSNGDITHRDAYGQRLAPSAEYVLVGDVTSLPALGTVVTYAGKKIMLTQIVVNTAQGAAPTASVSGVEVESGASTARTYSCGTIALSARHRAQDILSLHSTLPATCTEASFTFAVDPSFADPKGSIEASDVHNGRVSASYTHTSGTGDSITPPTLSGTDAVVSEPVSKSSPENDYVNVTYSITDTLTGTDPSNG